MKHVFVGDIHGKVNMVEKALALEGKKVFVGDIIDSYDRSVEDHKKCYDLIFDAIEKGEAECLFGNHELSYILPHIHGCSGKSSDREQLMVHYGPLCQKYFKPYLMIGKDLLVTHAGLNRRIWESAKLTLGILADWLKDGWQCPQTHPVHWVGRARGGVAPVGGIFWSDFNTEFQPIDELKQIFGHTRGKGIRQYGDSYCIDCLDFTEDFLLKEIEV